MKAVEVNVYSDASVITHGPNRGDGAWGAVIVRPGEDPFEASGKLKDDVVSSTIAELRAAANALHAALAAGLIKPGDRVVVRCDNDTVAGLLAGVTFKKNKVRLHRIAVLEWITKTSTERGFEVSGIWIRGHQPAESTDPHVRHNRRADHLCARVLSTRKVKKSRDRPPPKVRRRMKAKDEA